MNLIRTRLPQVALYLPTSVKTCRELLRGILQFVHLHGPWTVHIIEGPDGERKLVHPEAWGCTGLIADLESCVQCPKALLSANVPMILTHPSDDLLRSNRSLAKLSRVVCDNLPIGMRAAEYFLDLKYRNFAFVGQVNDALWSEQRKIAFCTCLAKSGFSCSIYPRLTHIFRKNFSLEQARLCTWLKSLQKPVAILVANDVRAQQVLNSCVKAGLAVPHEVAVLGVDNDELLCETTNPQLSSIKMSTEHAGFEAARVLDGIMRCNRNTKFHRTIITYGFLNLVTRRSTEVLQISDLLVARTTEFIRINAGISITVGDIVNHLGASRRLLETRFKSVMGRTIYAEIMRVRLERVQTLLRQSTMTIDDIADSCGFSSASHLCTLFKLHFYITPSAYRRQTQEMAD